MCVWVWRDRVRLTSHAGKWYVCLGVKGQGETDKVKGMCIWV